MRKLDKFLNALFLLLFFSCNLTFAQKSLKQAIIASGGNFSDPANHIKLFTYNPASKSLTVFDSIPGRFTRDLVIDNEIAYISADSMLYTYDLNTYQRKDSKVLHGINRMRIHRNFLIVSRWYPATSNFIQVFEKQTLNPVYNDVNVTSSTKGISVLRDTVYIAVNAFDSGKVAVISLSDSTPLYVKQINLDTLARLTDDVFTEGNNLVTLSYPYGADYNTVSIYNLTAGTAKYDTMRSAIEGIALENNMLYANFGKGLQSYNVLNSTLNPVISSMNYYRGSYDSLNKNFYLIDFNFTSNNKIYVQNISGQVLDTFETGISTEAVAFDYRDASGITDNIPSTNGIELSVYPNPSNGIINILSNKEGRFNIRLKDITGRNILEKSISLVSNTTEQLNVETLPRGVYLLTVNNGQESVVNKIIIE